MCARVREFCGSPATARPLHSAVPVKSVYARVAVIGLVFAARPVSTQGRLPAQGTSERLTLDTAVKEALDKNLELIAKRVGVSIADANLVTARVRPNPVLSAGGDHLDLLGTGYDRVNNAGPPEYSARVDFLFERGDKRDRRTEVAEDERAIAEAEVRDAIRSLTIDVRQAFIDVQLAEDNLTLARENAAALEEIVNLNQTRVRSGDLAEVELLRSRIAALQSQQTVRAAELKVRSERRRLELVIGRTPGSDTVEIAPLDPRPSPNLPTSGARAALAVDLARPAAQLLAGRGQAAACARQDRRSSAPKFDGKTVSPGAAIRTCS